MSAGRERHRGRRAGAIAALLALAAIVPAGPTSATASSSTDLAGAPTDLTVNYASQPLGIESSPRFGWNSQLAHQRAYEIRVATTSGLGSGGVWDSGKVVSSQDLQVAYGGPAPRSQTRYFWQVRVWNDRDQASAWSSPSWWETGLLSQSDWGGARWVGGRQPQDHDWTDMKLTVNFRVTNATSGIGFMFHARPVGKTWGEAYNWQLAAAGGLVPTLTEQTVHYLGSPYNPQAEANPPVSGTASRTLRVVPVTNLAAGSLTAADHRIVIDVQGATVTTSLDGTVIDSSTVGGGDRQPDGSIGFASGSAAIVRNVTVEAPGKRTFQTDFRGATNPFEAGVPTWTAPSGSPATDGLVPAPAKNTMLPIANPAPVLRRDFLTSAQGIASARLYVAGGGFPKLSVNGQPVTLDGAPPAADGHNVPHLIPDQTNYDKTVLYDTFDVTRLIRAGAHNALGAELGRGWYGMTVPDEWYWHMTDYHGAPRLLAKLTITYTDGSNQTIVSDPAGWKTNDGPTTFDSVYTGEKYDARIAAALGDWPSPGYDDSAWKPATLMNPPGSCTGPAPACTGFIPDTPPAPGGFVSARLKAQENEPVTVNQVLHPVAIHETAPGSKVYIFDMGQIMTGWVHLHLAGISPGQSGLTIRIRKDELQTGSGTTASPYSIVENNGYVDAESQTDYYTLSGAGTQDWEPSFSYAGYRYVEVRGLYDVLGRAPNINTDAGLLTAQVARSGFATTGSFSSSNALLNRIHQNVRWAEQNNSVQKETDTPTREKNGWTGDGQAGSESEMLDFDMNRFFTKWLRDFPDSSISTGEIPKIVPAAKGWYGYDRTPGFVAASWGPLPAWDAALFVIPSELYRYYGNAELLRELYPTQKRLMDYYATRFTPADQYTYATVLGEYAAATTSIADPNTAVINHQYYYYFADYMARVAARLGDRADATRYRSLANDVLAAFVRKYWNPAARMFTGGNLESENAMALAFGMVPGATPAEKSANRAGAAAAIAGDLAANGDHIQAGVYGLHYLFSALDEYGYTNLAYAVATQTTAPSYGDQIAQGATSLWEFWTSSPIAPSRDHHYFSSIATWFYQGLAGIRPGAPGYRRILVIPHVPTNSGTSSVPPAPATSSTLSHVSASIQTARGSVSSSWSRTGDGRVALRACIPANTPGQVWVPTMGKPVVAPPGSAFVRHDSQGANPYDVYSVGAGCYSFNG